MIRLFVRITNSAGYRLLLIVLAAFVVGWIISELSYSFLKSSGRDTPQEIELIIPLGTSDRIARGETNLAISKELTFVSGDVLIVRNQDTVSHQLGPIWVPAGSAGTLNLDSPNYYQISCSFQPDRIMGFNVRPALTPWIRMQGILSIGLPSGILFWLYSIVLWPVKKISDGVWKA